MNNGENTPTIKGIFVSSHIKALEKSHGPRAVEELKKRCGFPSSYRNFENVPVRDEVKIIECILDITGKKFATPGEREFEAGRLHFRNFTTTPLAKIIFSVFRTDFKILMMNTPNIAGHVFQGVKFSSEDLGPNSVKVIMENNDYPIAHFRGLFQEWMEFSGRTGNVEARETGNNVYEYIIEWQ